MDAALVTVTILTLALAATMSLVAWRVVRDERRRSDARVAALAAGIHGEPPAADHELFATPAPVERRFAIIGGAALVLGLVAAAAVVFTASAPKATAVATAPASTAAPLELVELNHVRDRETLIIRGAVRNPASGAMMQHVAVIVSGFAADGTPAPAVSMPIESEVLAPDTQARFTAVLANAVAVERYRVRFEIDGRVLEHVDDRD
jgi:hypothetical protein